MAYNFHAVSEIELLCYFMNFRNQTDLYANYKHEHSHIYTLIDLSI